MRHSLPSGASVAEYLNIPKFDEANEKMAAIGSIARDLTKRAGNAQPADLDKLDAQVRNLLLIYQAVSTGKATATSIMEYGLAFFL